MRIDKNLASGCFDVVSSKVRYIAAIRTAMLHRVPATNQLFAKHAIGDNAKVNPMRESCKYFIIAVEFR